jgi:hypothetical protein
MSNPQLKRMMLDIADTDDDLACNSEKMPLDRPRD